jgi:hypothetical protein
MKGNRKEGTVAARAGVVPFLGVTDQQNAPPLTPSEKFYLFAKAAFDPATLALLWNGRRDFR